MLRCTPSFGAHQVLVKRGLTTLALLGVCLGTRGVEAKPYKGAEVFTQSQYQFGRIEVRMRAARGGGILSTFFTYKPGSEGAGVAWEEIDVEIFGKSNASAFQSNILVGNPRVGSEQVHQAAASLADGYHTYTIEWTPTSVVWKVDGVESRRTTGGQANQLTSKHNFRFNLWASDVSSWAGAFESSSLPQYQYVNWIRYYRYENGAFVLDWSDDFNTFDTARWSKADWTFDGNLVDFDPNNAVAREGTLVLCLTAQGQGGCSGAVPTDSSGNGGSGGTSSGGTSSGGTSSGASGGGAGGNSGASSGGVAGNGGTPAGGSATGGSATGGAAGTGGIAQVGGGGAATGGVAAAAGAPVNAGGMTGMPNSSGGQATGGAAVGSSGAAVANPATPQPLEDGGCGCAVAGRGTQGWLAFGLSVGLAATLRRRRKQPRSGQTRRP